jgi:hypothetical protein
MELDAERWLGQQNCIIYDIFERAATELQDNGIRLLLGSTSPTIEEVDCDQRISIVPLRFGKSDTDEKLCLSLLATIRRGPPRYAVILNVAGRLTYRTLQTLTTEHADILSKTYLKVGLWITEGATTEPLNDLSQITQMVGSNVNFTGVYLHSDLGRRIQQGVMTLGVLYRGVLDGLSGAGNMSRLYTQLSNSLDYRTTKFQRIIRP